MKSSFRETRAPAGLAGFFWVAWFDAGQQFLVRAFTTAHRRMGRSPCLPANSAGRAPGKVPDVIGRSPIECWLSVAAAAPRGEPSKPLWRCSGRSCWRSGTTRRTSNRQRGAGRLEHVRYRWSQGRCCGCSSGIREVPWWRGARRDAAGTPPNAMGSFRLRRGFCRELTGPDRRGVGCARRCKCTGTAFECQRGLLRFVVAETAFSAPCTLIWLNHTYVPAGW